VNGDGPNIATLLRRSESDSLDFKQENYLFPGGTDDEKGELLKDILALANAWKESDGHIVIGAAETHGRATSVLGIEPTLKDNEVQQLVNSKTNRPVSFAVEHVPFEGKILTVIQIKQGQSRPIFLRKNYGRLKANTVYIRRGSCTEEASPDEIGEMAREDLIVTQAPNIVLSFEILLETWYLDLPSRRPDLGQSFEVDFFCVIATNQGTTLAKHVQGSITLPCDILYDDHMNAVESATRKIDFSNKLAEPVPGFSAALPADWKPLSPGMRLTLLRERVLELREGLKALQDSIRWELAVDSCKLKTGETKFSDLLIVDRRQK
jgi:schlafen family protein